MKNATLRQMAELFITALLSVITALLIGTAILGSYV